MSSFETEEFQVEDNPKPKRARVFANKRSHIYHDATRNNDRCRKSAVKAANRVSFNSTDEAIRNEYRACEHCFGEE